MPCEWDDPGCGDRIVMPPDTPCSVLTDHECEDKRKIPGKSCRLFDAGECREVFQCSDLTALGEGKCSGLWFGQRIFDPDTKFCYWQDNKCIQVDTLPRGSDCAVLPDEVCEIPFKIRQTYCRSFGVGDCRKVEDCPELTPLGQKGCRGQIFTHHCSWSGGSCGSILH